MMPRRSIGFDDESVVSSPPRRDRESNPLDTLKSFGWVRDETVLIFDASALCYRAFHTRELSSELGKGTGVLHGVLQMIRSTCDAANTRRWLLVWDGGVEYRRVLYPKYKSRHDKQRSPEEQAEHDERRSQVKLARRTLNELNAPSLSHRLIEADDLIGIAATAAMKAIRNGRNPSIKRVCVVSDDKDTYQLLDAPQRQSHAVAHLDHIDHGCVVWRACTGKLVTPGTFAEEFGFTPERYPDYKALVGEPATGDNIRGVDGIGDVTAAKLIAAHGTLTKAIFAAIDATKAAKCPKVLQTLAAQRHRAYESQALSFIAREPIDLKRWHAAPPVKASYFTDDDIADVRSRVAVSLKLACKTARPCDASVVRKLRTELGFVRSFDRLMWETVCGFRVC